MNPQNAKIQPLLNSIITSRSYYLINWKFFKLQIHQTTIKPTKRSNIEQNIVTKEADKVDAVVIMAAKQYTSFI